MGQLLDGQEITSATEVHVVTRPLTFRSRASSDILGELGNIQEIKLGFVDSKHFDLHNYNKTLRSKIRLLGPFKVELNPDGLKGYITQQLED